MPPSAFPRIHISCPCVETRESVKPSQRRSHSGTTPPLSGTTTPRHSRSRSIAYDEEEEGATFDPWDVRANYSLFPLDNLLYCEDCGQVRCPRCVNEEIVCYFCPNCLFEVPSATVKAEGNRCNRNCFQCPLCFASLSVVASDPHPTTDAATGIPTGPFSLLCNFCHWSTQRIGIEFEKPTSITTQLSKMETSATQYQHEFDRLKTHYTQKAKATQEEFGGAALSRLMGMYSMGGRRAKNAKKTEAQDAELVEDIEDDDDIIEKMKWVRFDDTTSLAQSLPHAHSPRFTTDLLPLAVLLRTKRSKRCRACRHILVKPESKVQSIRFRIKLVAMNYIPTLTLSRLDSNSINYAALRPLTTHKYLLTVTNPLFDPISVTLATPSKAPGKYAHGVTILCPQFEVGANTDVWEEALQDANSAPGDRNSKGGPLSRNQTKSKYPGAAGNIFDAGRNWTAVIIEVVPQQVDEEYWERHRRMGYEELEEEQGLDEAVVQIPVFVRVEYETVREDADLVVGEGGKEKREKREHAYWYVLSVGRIGKILGAPTLEEPGVSVPGTPVR